ncbi:MAG: ATP synthase subunit B [Gammaproteobacteria bacterium]|nr:ATP synthase subunit B [Gammaproteobacteria bacterium]
MNMNLTLLGQAIGFILFVWFCNIYVWPYILKALEEREKRVADGLAAAAKGHHELELAEKRATDILRDGKTQSQGYITQAQKRADELVDEAKQNAQAEASRIIAAGRAQIEQERQQVREELRTQVARLAVAGAEQILMREVDQATHKEVLSKISASL